MAETIRKRLEGEEDAKLHPRAARSPDSRGRARSEDACSMRPAFQVDRDRILHSKSFRRLSQKTQVFLAPRGDHYRTRLTHTLEVAQIGRTLSSAMGLNESLTEAIALGHDLGHTPFGHAGEKVLNATNPAGFHHSRQSLRVVDILERDGKGLNLTDEVREGIVKHSKGKGKLLARSSTLEAQVVRIADLVAYLNHDLDDALRAKVLSPSEIPGAVLSGLGETHGKRISTVVADIIKTSLGCELDHIAPSAGMHDILLEFRAFLYERVYENPKVHADFAKASKLMEELFHYLVEHSDMFLDKYAQRVESDSIEALVTDFIAGMTDRFAIKLYEKFFMPQPWKVL